VAVVETKPVKVARRKLSPVEQLTSNVPSSHCFAIEVDVDEFREPKETTVPVPKCVLQSVAEVIEASSICKTLPGMNL
jgi:hypothetical protein